MSAKAVREYHGKKLIARHVKSLSERRHVIDDRSVLVTPLTDLEALPETEPWLLSTSLVVKPDQLIKRRGKAGLVGIKLDWNGVKAWIAERMEKEIKVESVSGKLDHFIVEPFVPHASTDEYYICIQSVRDGEDILFYSQGGVDVGDVDAKASRLHVEIDDNGGLEERIMSTKLLAGVPTERMKSLASFVEVLFKVYRKLNFVYMVRFAFCLTRKSHFVYLKLTLLYRKSILLSTLATVPLSLWISRPRLMRRLPFSMPQTGGIWTFQLPLVGKSFPRKPTFVNSTPRRVRP